jgi:hypothetical protein
MVGLDFAHWMFWPPVIAGLVGSAVLVAGARLTDDRDVSLPVFLLIAGMALRSTGFFNAVESHHLLNVAGITIMVGVVLTLIISGYRRRRFRNL